MTAADTAPDTAAAPLPGPPEVRPRVMMVPGATTIGGSRWEYAVSDNPTGPEPTWALNLHGYLAAGPMYFRESARLAAATGWKVLTPSLPGFGGSDPLAWERLSFASVVDDLVVLADRVGARGPMVVLGHSMGGAVATQLAARHPDRVRGMIYRDGAATPSWRHRRGPLAALLSPVVPDVGALAELIVAALCDLPDLAFGRLTSNLATTVPDVRRNLRALGSTLPLAALLFTADLRPELAEVSRRIPLLVVWGRYDRVTPAATAREVEAITGVRPVWVAGGHSWMLARPGTQARILRRHRLGREFLAAVDPPHLRAVG